MKFTLFTAGAIAISLAIVLFILDISNGIMSRAPTWLTPEIATTSGALLVLGAGLIIGDLKRTSDEPTSRKRRRSGRR